TFTGILILLAWVGLNEEDRMEEFTERFNGRSVERGAILFENNCSECHGQYGYGLEGVAPALNSHQLFGYDYFAPYDQELARLESELEALQEEPESPEVNARIEELEAQIRQVEDERREVEERLLYDYSDRLEPLQRELEQLDQQIIEQFGEAYNITSPTLLTVTVNNLQSEISALEAEQAELQAEVSAAQEAGEDPDPADQERLAEIEVEITALQEELEPLENLNNRRTTLVAQVGRFRALNDANQAVANLREQIAEVESELDALPPAPQEGADPDAEARAALNNELDQLDDQLSRQLDARDEARQALIDAGDIIPWDPDRDASRTDELAWEGSLRDLIKTTLVSGRPTSSSYWPRPMASWSQEGGGPLRDDEVEDLVDYIMNWDRDFTVEDQRKITQYPRIPTTGGGAEMEGEAVGTDVDSLVTELNELEVSEDTEIIAFDSQAGQAAWQDLGCAGCHIVGGGGAGPDPTGVYTRAEMHAEEDDYESPRHYLVESIVLPNAFLAEVNGVQYAEGVMPQNFGDQLDIVTLSNLIAYLESFD
ncbi:MAG: c-type cytochrome, partial [Chloroflexi bacterium]|nr:c-type cytochrome [Chloroflexota bacterium]